MKTRVYLLWMACLLALMQPALAQDNFVGDGFGGRSWYKPSNLDAGWNSGAAILNGQLYMWGDAGNAGDYSLLIQPYPGVNYLGVPTTNGLYANPYPAPGFANTKLISLDYLAGAIKTDGSGWAWGPIDQNNNSQYTPFSAPNRSTLNRTPTQVIAGGAYHVSAGKSHVAFVKTDGTVWSVGWNRYGNFGNGSTDATQSYKTPVQMTGITNAVRVAVHGSADEIGSESTHNYAATLVLKRDGTVWVAGGNTVLTNSGSSNLPVQVTPLANVVDIKAGYNYAVALTAAGDVYSWGERYFAVLGNGETQGSTTPLIYTTPRKVAFPAGTPPIVAIETESSSLITYAIDEAGTLWGWGFQGQAGLLGINTNNTAIIPVICARYVADITLYGPTLAYMTRNSAYPADQRVWFNQSSGGNSSQSIVFTLNINEIDAGTTLTNGSISYGKTETTNHWLPTNPASVGLSGLGVIASNANGSIDCSKTQIVTAPVVGSANQLSLVVTMNVSATGTFSPVTVSGSGMSLANGVTSITATKTGIQQFQIPINYDGTALTSGFQFTIGSSGSCSADLTQKSNPIITNVWTLNNCSAITPGVLSK